jgi:hypothetical protein
MTVNITENIVSEQVLGSKEVFGVRFSKKSELINTLKSCFEKITGQPLDSVSADPDRAIEASIQFIQPLTSKGTPSRWYNQQRSKSVDFHLLFLVDHKQWVVTRFS